MDVPGEDGVVAAGERLLDREEAFSLRPLDRPDRLVNDDDGPADLVILLEDVESGGK